MIFVFIFVAGMLLIPVMIDTRRHPTNNILRRSDKDLLEFQFVKAIKHLSPISTERLTQAFPGAVMLSLLVEILAILLLVYYGVLLLVAIIPGLVSLLIGLCFSVLSLLGSLVENLGSKTHETLGTLGVLLLAVAVLVAITRGVRRG